MVARPGHPHALTRHPEGLAAHGTGHLPPQHRHESALAHPASPAEQLGRPQVALIAKPGGAATGVGRYVAALHAGLRGAGIAAERVAPAVPSLPDALYAAARGAGADLRAFLATYPVWARLPQADVYHLTSQNLASLLLFRRPRGRVVVTVHDIIPHLVRGDRRLCAYHTLADRLFDQLAMRGLRRADLLIADSFYTQACLTGELKLPAERVAVVHLGVDHERFRPGLPTDAVRARHDLPAGRRFLLYVGSEDPRKNLDALIRALAAVRATHPDVALIKVGRAHFAAERDRLQALAGQLGVADAIHWLDHVAEDELPALYALAAVCVLPSFYEGFGFPVLEAMACGTPVAYAEASSLPELAAGAGAAFDPHDPASLAASLRSLLDSDAARSRATTAGLRRAAAFTWERTLKRTAALYHETGSVDDTAFCSGQRHAGPPDPLALPTGRPARAKLSADGADVTPDGPPVWAGQGRGPHQHGRQAASGPRPIGVICAICGGWEASCCVQHPHALAPASDPTVAILKTGLAAYSADPCAEATPETRALADLRGLYRAGTSADLFAAVRPGDRVVIKPNLVRDRHPDGHDLFAVITSPAVIAAVVAAVYAALGGRGEIIIADAPMGDTDFERLVALTGLDRLAEHYRRHHGFQVQIRDLRKFRYRHERQPGGYVHEVGTELPGDPEGYRVVDLGHASAFAALDGAHLLEGTDIARRRETIASHSGDTHRYLVAGTVLGADVLISLPKLKTHAKVGLTVNCKGMVGINGDKNWLPHFRWGSPAEGGDQFPPQSQSALDQGRMRLGRLVADTLVARRDAPWARAALQALQVASGAAARAAGLPPVTPVNGDWPGNDTCWRLPADLMRVALYADREGRMCATPQRRFLTIVDGIVAGEGDGPLRPTPRPSGVLVGGLDPVAVDRACARLMGFDESVVRYLQALIADDAPPPVVSNHGPWSDLFTAAPEELLGLAPPSRWAGHLELARSAAVPA